MQYTRRTGKRASSPTTGTLATLGGVTTNDINYSTIQKHFRGHDTARPPSTHKNLPLSNKSRLGTIRIYCCAPAHYKTCGTPPLSALHRLSPATAHTGTCAIGELDGL